MTSDGLAPRADRNRRRLWLARRPHAPDVERRMGHGRHAGIAASRPPHTANRSNAMSLEENTAHRSTADRQEALEPGEEPCSHDQGLSPYHSDQTTVPTRGDPAMTGRQVHEPRARRRGGPGDPLRPSPPAVAIPVTSPQWCCPSTGQRDRYVDELIEVGSSASMPDLCGPRLPAALYHVPDRGGLGVVAVSDSALTEHQHDVLSRFRFAQYLAAGFIDRDVAFRERLDRDTLTDAPVQRCADTVH